MKIFKKRLFGLILLMILIYSFSFVFAQMDESMESMGDDSDVMDLTMGNPFYDKLNQIAYPITAIFAIFTFWVCITLIKATGMKDKFGLVAVGLFMFFIQAVMGMLHYVSNPNGKIIAMSTLMFSMSLLTSLGLILIGIAFYRWKKMLG